MYKIYWKSRRVFYPCSHLVHFYSTSFAINILQIFEERTTVNPQASHHYNEVVVVNVINYTCTDAEASVFTLIPGGLLYVSRVCSGFADGNCSFSWSVSILALACFLFFVITISKTHAYNAMRNLLYVREHILPVAVYGRPYSRCNRSPLNDNDHCSASAQVTVI